MISAELERPVGVERGRYGSRPLEGLGEYLLHVLVPESVSSLQ